MLIFNIHIILCEFEHQLYILLSSNHNKMEEQSECFDWISKTTAISVEVSSVTLSLIQFKGVGRTSSIQELCTKWRNFLTPGIFGGVQRLSLTHDNRIVWLNRARNRRWQTPSISSKGVMSRARLNAIYSRFSCLWQKVRTCACVVYAFLFFLLPAFPILSRQQ